VLLQPIFYRGRLAAACTRRRFYLTEELVRRAPTDPERTFVVFMCAYACAVLRDELPGPYRQDAARHFARASLIPAELLERDALDIARAATPLRVPTDELQAARTEHRRSNR
jgi:hypothetical protein